MNTTSLRSRYEELKQRRGFHNDWWYIMDSTVITDVELVKLLDE